MAHTASLLHDDVIDEGVLRRGLPALWQLTGPSAAVLMGDLLLCEALDLLLDTETGRFASLFLAKLKEMCAAEAEQELSLRGRRLDQDTCLRIARSKTGAMFAFIGAACGAGDGDLAPALEEVGYLVGAAYQLADDLLDMTGSESVAGKTLGTDSKRQKATLPYSGKSGNAWALDQITRLLNSAIHRLEEWPAARVALVRYLADHLQPVLQSWLPLPEGAIGMIN
jgi:geranylgeranyl pyrophosphate synthase